MSGSVVGVIEFQLNALLMMKITSDVPQNVNFAIQTPIVMNFLSVKGIQATLAGTGHKNVDPADVADIAKTFTVHVACEATVSSPPEPSPSVETATPPRSAAPVHSLLDASLGFWAIGDRTNCEVPVKAFSLKMNGGSIVWQNGSGDVDIETILSNGKTNFGLQL
jgi:hypothetical protein